MADRTNPFPATTEPRPPARFANVPVRRFSTGVNPEQHSLSSLDPVLTRRGGKLAHKSVLVMVAAGLLFMAYAFDVGGLQGSLDGIFDAVNHAAQSQSSFVVRAIISVLPYLGGAILGLLVFALLRSLFRGAKSVGKRQRLSRREEISSEEFLLVAHQDGISSKVAREAYRMLTPHYKHRMRAHMSDSLTRDIHLSRHDVVNLYAHLLSKADRHRKALHSGPVPETVLELLLAVERAPVRSAAAHPPLPLKGVRLESFVRPRAKL